jgi:hypothetical protein
VNNPQAVDWSGLKAAAIALQSVNEAARRASINLPPAEAERFRNRVNKRAYRERWLDQNASLAETATVRNAKHLSKNVQTGSELLANMAQAEHNPAILSLVEKREYLASIVRTPVGDVDENSKLAQKVKRKHYRQKDGSETDEEEIELPGKLRAIELDAKLAGELDSSGAVTGPTLNVLSIGGEMHISSSR